MQEDRSLSCSKGIMHNKCISGSKYGVLIPFYEGYCFSLEKGEKYITL